MKEMTPRRKRQRSEQPGTEHVTVKAVVLIITDVVWRARACCAHNDAARRRRAAVSWVHLPRLATYVVDATQEESAHTPHMQRDVSTRRTWRLLSPLEAHDTAAVRPQCTGASQQLSSALRRRRRRKETLNCKGIARWGASGGSWLLGEATKPRMSPRTTTGCRRDAYRDHRTLILVSG